VWKNCVQEFIARGGKELEKGAIVKKGAESWQGQPTRVNAEVCP